MQLPLPGATARAMALEHHLALVAMRSSHSRIEHLACLMRVLYLTYFIQEALQDRSTMDLLRAADAVLKASMERGAAEQPLTLSVDDSVLLEQVLTLHDQHLSCAAAHIFAAAQERLVAFSATSDDSPIAPIR